MKSISGKKLAEVLEKRGWELRRVTGIHPIFRNPETREIAAVPIHRNRDLKIGTLRSILKVTGLTENDLP
ncbi:MAG: type II toxin-antitoxin system HicA family toxin [Cyanobacteria bacterium SBC]|nr:type II toxin-antitoxin system HicA family toxin [Cyanobacteria bacterium SBC]